MDAVEEALCVLLWHQHQVVSMLANFTDRRFQDYAIHCEQLAEHYRWTRAELINEAAKRGFAIKSRPMSHNGMVNLLNGMGLRLTAGQEISLAMKPLGSPFVEKAAVALSDSTKVVQSQLTKAISEYGSSVIPHVLQGAAAGLKKQPENEDG